MERYCCTFGKGWFERFLFWSVLNTFPILFPYLIFFYFSLLFFYLLRFATTNAHHNFSKRHYTLFDSDQVHFFAACVLLYEFELLCYMMCISSVLQQQQILF